MAAVPNIVRIKNFFRSRFMRSLSDADLIIENARREGPPDAKSFGIVPEMHLERPVKLQEWVWAVNARKNPPLFNGAALARIYDNTMSDLHLLGVVDSRIAKVKAAKFRLIDPSGEEDPGAMTMFQGQWFKDFIQHSLESIFYGTTLLSLTDQRTEQRIVKTNSGTKTYTPLKAVSIVKRTHVRPVQAVVVKNVNDDPSRGENYTDPPYDIWYMPVGSSEDLGLLKVLTPYILAKRYAFAAWSEFDEKLGIPFRSVQMQGQNPRREEMLAQIMSNMGSAGWAILHPGEEIEYLETARNDIHKCFLELLEWINKEVSKAVLGQTMSTEDGSSLAQARVHASVANDRHEADISFMEALVNDELFPRLIAFGWPLEGYTFVRNDKEEVSITEQIKIDGVLLNHYSLGKEYLSSRYGVPEDQILDKPDAAPAKDNNGNPPPDDPNDPTKDPEDSFKGPFPKPNPAAAPTQGQQGTGAGNSTGILNSLYADIHICAVHGPTAAITDTPAIPEDLLAEFFNAPAGRDRAYFPQLTAHTQEWLQKALNQGMPAKDVSSQYQSFDQNLRLHYEASIHPFAFAKEVGQVLQLNELAKSAANKEAFIKAAKALNKDFNAKYVGTEFNNARAFAQNAAAMIAGIQAGHTHWRWQAIVDDRTRPQHVADNGKVFEINGYDSPSLKCMPPTDHECRCKGQPFTPTRRELASLKIQDPEAFLAAIPNRAKLEKYGFLQNKITAKNLIGSGAQYLEGFPDAPTIVRNKLSALTAELQGLPSYAQIQKRNLPKAEPWAADTALEKATAEFARRATNNGSDGKAASFTDYNGDTLFLTESQFRTHIQGGKYESENRAGYFKMLPEVLKNPDEVFFRNDKELTVQYSYIKYYAGDALEVVLEIPDKGDPRLKTWFVIRPDELKNRRTGLLTKKAAN